MKYQIYYEYECGCGIRDLTFNIPIENDKIEIKKDLGICPQCNEKRKIKGIKKRKTNEKGDIIPADEVIE
jgi:hypothetical protein